MSIRELSVSDADSSDGDNYAIGVTRDDVLASERPEYKDLLVNWPLKQTKAPRTTYGRISCRGRMSTRSTTAPTMSLGSE